MVERPPHRRTSASSCAPADAPAGVDDRHDDIAGRRPNVAPAGRLLPPRDANRRIGLIEIVLFPYHCLLSLFERR